MHKTSLREKDMRSFCTKYIKEAKERGFAKVTITRNFSEIVNLMAAMTSKTDLTVTFKDNTMLVAAPKRVNNPSPQKRTKMPVGAIFTPMAPSAKSPNYDLHQTVKAAAMALAVPEHIINSAGSPKRVKR